MKLTYEHLKMASTTLDKHGKPCAWTKASTDVLGVEYPKKKGWIRHILNKEYTAEQILQFVSNKTTYAKKLVTGLVTIGYWFGNYWLLVW